MKNIETACVQGGYTPEKSGDPRITPIYQSTTFYYETTEELADVFNLKDPALVLRMYSRLGNPTVSCFEQKMAELEGGVASLATSSGQAALFTTIINVCSCGDHIISSSAVYGGSYNLLAITIKKMGIDVTFVDPDCSIDELKKAVRPNTKIIYGETVANPAMIVLDFDKFAKVAKENSILFVVDNTLATPILCRPIEHGANIVTHSTTKYLDGHATSVGGIIVDAGNFNFSHNPRYSDFNTPDESYHGLVYTRDCGNLAFIIKARAQIMRDLGVCQSPQNAFYCMLGTETLHLRMKKHSENALEVAKALCKHKNIEWVKYPSLEDSRYNKLAKKYLPNGCGGMLSIGIKGNDEMISKFIKELKLIKLVTHVADSRSCLLHPASTTHRQLSDKALAECGIPKNLIRLSIGIENSNDIINDLQSALEKI